MKRKFRNTFIACLGIVVGASFSYFLISGVQQISEHTENFVASVSFADLGKEIYVDQGGPSATEILEDRKGKDVYFLNYDKSYKISNEAPIPYLTAESYLVGDIETGEVIFSKNDDKVLPIASISKLMTAIVADEELGLSNEVRVSETAVSTYGKQGNLLAGEIYTVGEILYPLLLESSNDAAEVLAEAGVRYAFMDLMNKKTRELEMYRTHFDDPSGLSPKNISTVSDLFKLTQYIEKYRNYVYEITRERKHELNDKIWFSNSKFRSDDDYYGGKNGYTDIAWKTQVAIFEMNISGENKKIVFIILKTDDIEGDIYGLKRYTSKYVTYE